MKEIIPECEPVTSTLVPSAFVPVKIHSENPRSSNIGHEVKKTGPRVVISPAK